MRCVAILAVLLFTAEARADERVALAVAGGIDAGIAAREAHPTLVAEGGLELAWFPRGEHFGFGASLAALGRLTPLYGSTEELRADFTVWIRDPSERLYGGVGPGIRELTFAPTAAPRSHVFGPDFLHLELEGRLARWSPAPRVQLEAVVHVAWAFGCYSGTYREAPVGDMLPPMRNVSCEVTSTYVLGLGVAGVLK